MFDVKEEKLSANELKATGKNEYVYYYEEEMKNSMETFTGKIVYWYIVHVIYIIDTNCFVIIIINILIVP